eukprot:897743-Amorphochlora_amoeboformis.AAC.1
MGFLFGNLTGHLKTNFENYPPASLITPTTPGLVFGLMDVEDKQFGELREALTHEQRLCYPIGIIVSAAAAAANQSWVGWWAAGVEYLREKNSQEYKYESLRK